MRKKDSPPLLKGETQSLPYLADTVLHAVRPEGWNSTILTVTHANGQFELKATLLELHDMRLKQGKVYFNFCAKSATKRKPRKSNAAGKIVKKMNHSKP